MSIGEGRPEHCMVYGPSCAYLRPGPDLPSVYMWGFILSISCPDSPTSRFTTNSAPNTSHNTHLRPHHITHARTHQHIPATRTCRRRGTVIQRCQDIICVRSQVFSLCVSKTKGLTYAHSLCLRTLLCPLDYWPLLSPAVVCGRRHPACQP